MDAIETTLELDKTCKHSNRFATKHPDAPVSSIYISKANMPAVKTAKKVKVTIEVLE